MRLVLICFLAVAAAGAAHARPLLPEPRDTVTVITTLPVTQDLAGRLAEGTAITARFFGPETGTLEDHARHLKASDAFARAAREADAVVTVRGAWPADPLFPLARAANVRIVEIDAVAPVEPGRVGLGVRTMPDAGESAALIPHVWSSPANVAKMADIMAADFKRLAPEDAAQLDRNLASVKRILFAMRAQAQQVLAEAPVAEVISLHPSSLYLCQDLGVHTGAWFLEDPYRWHADDRARFLHTIERLEAPAVLSAFQLDAELVAAVIARGAQVAVIDPLVSGLAGTGDGSAGFIEALEANLTRLTTAMSRD